MKHITLTYLVLLFPIYLFSQWSYPVVNYSRQIYKAGAQNWQIRQAPNGWIYVANNKGLLEYNGQNWTLYTCPNDNVRSMMIIPGKRIYVGGIAEFGYFEPDIAGHETYYSVSKNIIKKKGSFGNVWNIFQSDQVIYYQTDGMVVKQSAEKVSYVDAKMKIDCSALNNGLLYAGTRKGLFILLGNHFSLAKNSELLTGKRIRSIIPLASDKLLIATANDGLYIYENEVLYKFHTEIDNFIKENELFSCAVSSNFIAVGTIGNGVAILTKQGKAVTYSNMSNGLQDNTVLSLYFDSSENLWMGLNRGISCLKISEVVSTLYSSSNFYGVGYSAKIISNQVFMGTNSGLFYTNWPIPVSPNPVRLNAIQGLNGQVWDLNIIRGKLFCAHDKGVFILNGAHTEQFFDTGGAWSCKLSNDSGSVLIGTYSGMFRLSKEGARWAKLTRIKGFYESTKFFEQDKYGIWISHDQKGIIRLQLADDGVTLKSAKSYGYTEGIPFKNKIGIEKIGAKIIFISSVGIYTYNATTDKMELDNGPHGYNNYFRPGTKRLGAYKDDVWALSENQLVLFSKDHHYTNSTKEGYELKEGYEMISPLSPFSALISSEKGFYLADFQKKPEKNKKLYMQILRVTLTQPDSVIYQASIKYEKKKPEISYRTNSIKFKFGTVSFLSNSGVSYSYKLEGYEDWSVWDEGTIKEYTDLHEGDYIFKVKARTRTGKSAYDEFHFIVLPPWYRSWWAYLFYIIVLVFVMRYLKQIDQMRIKRHGKVLEAKKQAELEAREVEFQKIEMEREKEIIELKSEQLENDLLHKSRELSNVMLNFVSKNEMLQDIKSDLLKISSSIPENDISKKRLIALSQKINQNMQHDEDWKKFEQNFDYVNNGLLQKLTDLYPELTYSERKMCVYLKMDLLSKEIASLLNISPRSVETVRYRLRKKFNLDRDENLRDFLSRL